MGRDDVRRSDQRRGDLEELMVRAVQLLRSGDATGAEPLLRRCWEARDPEWSALAGLHLGELWLGAGRSDEAISILREAVDRWGHPTYGAQALITLGVALAATGDADGAARQYRTVMQQKGHPLLTDVAQFNLAELAHRRGRMDEAETHYRAVASGTHPELGPRAGVNLGVLYSELGRLELAREAFSRVLSSGHAEQSELARRNLVLLEQAEAGSRRAGEGAAHDHDAARSAVRRGEELHARGDLAGAEASFRIADQLGSGEGASGLGALLFERGEVVSAEAALRRADQRRDPTGTFRLGFLLEETGRAGEALAVYSRAAELGSTWAMGNLGTMLRQRGDLDGARAAYEQIIASTADEKERALARRELAQLAGGARARPVPPASFDPEASAVDSLLWIAGDPNDERVQRARAFVLAFLEPPLRQELAALIREIDGGTVSPARVSVARYAQALLDRKAAD
jgi:tetratricopeptide (TPR) repeat protein